MCLTEGTYDYFRFYIVITVLHEIQVHTSYHQFFVRVLRGGIAFTRKPSSIPFYMWKSCYLIPNPYVCNYYYPFYTKKKNSSPPCRVSLSDTEKNALMICKTICTSGSPGNNINIKRMRFLLLYNNWCCTGKYIALTIISGGGFTADLAGTLWCTQIKVWCNEQLADYTSSPTLLNFIK